MKDYLEKAGCGSLNDATRQAKRPIKLDEYGVPVDAMDWTVEDWGDLWNGIQMIRAMISNRHNPK
jgi:hypothetical protein